MSIDPGNLARYIIIAALGIAVLVLIERGELAEVYNLAGYQIQTAIFGWGAIGFAAVVCILAYLFWLRNML